MRRLSHGARSETARAAICQPCYQVHFARKYDETGIIPYTLAAHDKQDSHFARKSYFQFAGILVVTALIFAALVYGAGWVVAWIVRGFRTA